jgi:hypothetical protein
VAPGKSGLYGHEPLACLNVLGAESAAHCTRRERGEKPEQLLYGVAAPPRRGISSVIFRKKSLPTRNLCVRIPENVGQSEADVFPGIFLFL